MSVELLARLDQISNAFARIADRADWIRAIFTIRAGKVGMLAFGHPGGDGFREALLSDTGNERERPILLEVHELINQAGVLFAALLQSGQHSWKPAAMKTIKYKVQQPWEIWLLVLLITQPTCFQCWERERDGNSFIAVPQLGEDEIAVWIDNYAQTCVAALAHLKSESNAGSGRLRRLTVSSEPVPAVPAALPIAQWTKNGPFGLRLNLNTHTVERGGRQIEIEGNGRPWEVFVSLVDRYPGRYLVNDLGHDVWNRNGAEIDPGDNLVQ